MAGARKLSETKSLELSQLKGKFEAKLTKCNVRLSAAGYPVLTKPLHLTYVKPLLAGYKKINPECNLTYKAFQNSAKVWFFYSSTADLFYSKNPAAIAEVNQFYEDMGVSVKSLEPLTAAIENDFQKTLRDFALSAEGRGRPLSYEEELLKIGTEFSNCAFASPEGTFVIFTTSTISGKSSYFKKFNATHGSDIKLATAGDLQFYFLYSEKAGWESQVDEKDSKSHACVTAFIEALGISIKNLPKLSKDQADNFRKAINKRSNKAREASFSLEEKFVEFLKASTQRSRTKNCLVFQKQLSGPGVKELFRDYNATYHNNVTPVPSHKGLFRIICLDFGNNALSFKHYANGDQKSLAAVQNFITISVYQ